MDVTKNDTTGITNISDALTPTDGNYQKQSLALSDRHRMTKMGRKHTRLTNYIPTTRNSEWSSASNASDSDESSPLLDISKDIEQLSEDWPIDPEGNSVIHSDCSFFNGMRLAHPFGRPKRLMLEIFIMVNMAQLMYTAMLAFAKSAMLSHGASTANLYLYRCAVLLVI